MSDPDLARADGAHGLCVGVALLAPGVALGRAGEDAAATHLTEHHGLELVARNWRVALDELRGELDLVARDPRSGTLVVCEVKSRSRAGPRDGAAAALGPRQQAHIRRLTGVLLASGAIRAPRVRFDLVALDRLDDPPSTTLRLTHLSDAW